MDPVSQVVALAVEEQDRKERRAEMAMHMMAALLTLEGTGVSIGAVASAAVEAADALIEELEK